MHLPTLIKHISNLITCATSIQRMPNLAKPSFSKYIHELILFAFS